jgi:hypothetical protein
MREITPQDNVDRLPHIASSIRVQNTGLDRDINGQQSSAAEASLYHPDLGTNASDTGQRRRGSSRIWITRQTPENQSSREKLKSHMGS